MGILDGKIVIITGGGTGIGKSTAIKFADEGATLVICGRREEKLRETEAEIGKSDRLLVIPADVSVSEQAKAVTDACLEKYGRIDILMNIHGVQSEMITFLDRSKDETWDYVMGSNARGAFNMMREALKYMITAGTGNIVNYASVAGVNGGGDAVYVASKGAIMSLTKHVALAYSSRGIRCNAICPGGVNTPMTQPNMRGEGLDFDLLAEMTKHCWGEAPGGEPEQLADINLFYASDASKNITGQFVIADFGYAL